jgi:hypothetical protein
MILLHHSEPVDPTLLVWIRERIDAILGLAPATIVVVLGLVIVALPVFLLIRAVRERRAQRR